MRMRDRILIAGEDLAGHQAREVGHVDHKGGAHFVGYLAHCREVDPARIGGVPRDQDQRPELPRRSAYRVVVQQLGLGISAVGTLMEHLAGDIRPEAMSEVPARVERHAERSLITELAPQRLPLLLAQIVDAFHALRVQLRQLDPVGQDGPVSNQIRVDAGVWLGVRVLRAEELTRVLGSDRLDRVDVLTAGVKAMPDGSLGVLVGQPAAHGQQYGR